MRASGVGRFGVAALFVGMLSACSPIAASNANTKSPASATATTSRAPQTRPTVRGWNATLLKDAGGLHTLTMHIYLHPRAVLGAAGAQRPDQVLSVPFSQWAALEQHSLRPLPPGTSVWVTEYNMMNEVPGPHGQRTFPPPQGTWTNGLFAGTMDLLFLRDARITLVDYHALVGTYGGYGAVNPITGQLSPSGAVQQLIHQAAAGMSSTEPLAFAGGPMLLHRYPGLVGCVFRNAAGATDAVLLNLSNQAVSLQLPRSLSAAMVQEEVRGAPSATLEDALHTSRASVKGTLTLQPYAATYLHPVNTAN